MQEIHFYQIEVQGQLDEQDFNATSPIRVKAVQTEVATTLFSAYTDQSGVVGLIRHIHHQGFVLLAFSLKDNAAQEVNHAGR